MRQRLGALGVPVPRYSVVSHLDEVDAFAVHIGGPIVVKAVRGGYDGRGVYLPADVADARETRRVTWPMVSECSSRNA